MPNALTTWLKDHTGPIWNVVALIATITLFVGIVAGAGYILVKDSIAGNGTNDMRLSLIVLAGFGLTVAVLALLAVAFHLMDVDDPAMPLALPEGSIRALLTFSLVLIFVCLSAFLYSGISNEQKTGNGVTLNFATAEDVADLRTNFDVAAERAVDPKTGKMLYQQIPDANATTGAGPTTRDDFAHPLFKATYYPKPNKDASEFGKQIFTTLATIFISVVSFYFGSSVTSSAVKAGSFAAQGGPDADKTRAALTAANAAHTDVQKAQEELDTATAAPASESRIAELRKALDVAKSNQQTKQAVVTALQKP